MSVWDAELTVASVEGLSDGQAPIRVLIDDSRGTNAKWRLADVSKLWVFGAAWKRRGRDGGLEIRHMTDGLSIASEAFLDLWQGVAHGVWPPKLCAHWSICYLSPPLKWMGHSCCGSQWGHCMKNPDAFCQHAAVFSIVTEYVSSDKLLLVKGYTSYLLSINSRRVRVNLLLW